MKQAPKQGVAWPVPRTPEMLQNPWYTSSTKREQELLLFNLPNGYKYIDTSQSLSRVTTSRDASKLFTILSGADIWSTDLNGYLVGTEHLHLQGIPGDPVHPVGTTEE